MPKKGHTEEQIIGSLHHFAGRDRMGGNLGKRLPCAHWLR